MSPVVDTLTLTAEDAIGLVERAEISPSELHAAYLEAIGERDEELHCYLRTVDEAEGEASRLRSRTSSRRAVSRRRRGRGSSPGTSPFSTRRSPPAAKRPG